MYKSTIEIKEPKKLLEVYKAALEPEKDFNKERAKYDLKLSKDKLKIDIEAKDATIFRALMTSLTGLIALVEQNWRRIKNE